MSDLFPTELTSRAFRADNGEFGWSRGDAPVAIAILAKARRAILGGELWWVPPGATEWGLVPQRHGPHAVYHWDTQRIPGESWHSYVERCARESAEAVTRWPGVDDLPPNLEGRVLYNMTWVSESEYEIPASQLLPRDRERDLMSTKPFGVSVLAAVLLIAGLAGLAAFCAG